ncbi:MAG TPA: 30S ribosomal protein S17 [Candidatus Hydrothermia bacterium]|nr:30S ribosomal protein S17 [Candidatus Hydrothermae bacterium]MDD3648933.1 30S ribosomal protein S17 [Candidatus Hydrothermia bacterium]MDD5573399.1 30S ribosomal protein S17 [Candidatus Hydrothermia bacterium]HOK23174.1 30S ribosomal protein S17 [Candidatus Hydrothermia bacterium]HOL23878.1 30S ribosomal protein S17 [Candidatus Hydrothermia bacterium]
METMGIKRQRVGMVVGDKMDKTRVVVYEFLEKDPIYEKYVRRRKKFYVHDENNESRIGDLVKIEETIPLSKLKRWRLVEIIRKAERREE